MILTSYIFKQVLKSILISTLVFVGVIWLSQSFKIIKLIVEKGASIFDFFVLSAFSFPSWLLIALPFGTFAGCMISYLKLQNDNEIVVMKSAGISPLKISKPAFFVALISSLILFIISHFVLPKTYRDFKILQNEIRNSTQEFTLKNNSFIDINKNQTMFISKFNKGNILEEVFIQDRSNPLFIVEYFSKSGFMTINKDINLRMIDGTRVSTDSSGRSTLLNFDDYNISVKRDEITTTLPRVVEYNEYSFFELIERAEKESSNYGKFLAEAHTRNTIIFMPFVFVFIAMLTILNDTYSRIVTSYKKTVAIGIVFIVQSCVIILKNAVHTNVSFIPMMYLFPLLISTICFFFLYTRIEPHKKSFDQ